MAHKKWMGLIWCMFGLSTLAMAQIGGVKEDSDDQDSKYFGYGVTTNTHSGLLGGFVVRSSTPVSRSKKGLPIHRYLALELVNIKHPKENVSPTPLGTKFIYGKVNYLFAVRPEYGREWYFFRKNGDSSIGFSGILAGGPTIGIQKPYYIKYGRNANEQPTLMVYDPDVNTDLNAIVGSGSIWQGFFNNAKVIPGIHLKAAANIDMSTFGDSITGFELGATFEMYTKSPELISAKLSSNPKAYASAYVTLYFGNKKLIKK
ncbi:hypothetical protein LAG90_10115 [Marinilongibacter aquaticus]|uniref:hypothetical protein n=1 Tax=Marinilongibacter aquaticus TaxID=2975157 RepID=UPI0021BD4E6B|nr:hypothetical protein [Marinilongibacter aquaticus]UBM57175.1 hypothetical protein LAG90_10115 [Marinilongibacter aquaticus]